MSDETPTADPTPAEQPTPEVAVPAAPAAAPEAHAPQPEPTAEIGSDAVPQPATDPPTPEAVPAVTATADESDEATAKPARSKTKKAAKAAPAPPPDAAAEPVAPEPAASEPAAAGEPNTVPAEPAPESKKRWYAVKVQSGREESIKAAIERKVKIEGLDEFFGQIVIPVEEVIVKKRVQVKDKKTGEKVTQEKNVTKHQKKFHGYIFAEVEFNDQILYLFRETSGVGDFVGATGPMKPPPPMSEREVQSMLTGVPDPTRPKAGQPRKAIVKLDFEKGDKVRIRNGAFVNSEGEVKSITEPKDPMETPKVTVVVTLWGRPVDVEVDYWEVGKV